MRSRRLLSNLRSGGCCPTWGGRVRFRGEQTSETSVCLRTWNYPIPSALVSTLPQSHYSRFVRTTGTALGLAGFLSNLATPIFMSLFPTTGLLPTTGTPWWAGWGAGGRGPTWAAGCCWGSWRLLRKPMGWRRLPSNLSCGLKNLGWWSEVQWLSRHLKQWTWISGPENPYPVGFSLNTSDEPSTPTWPYYRHCFGIGTGFYQI